MNARSAVIRRGDHLPVLLLMLLSRYWPETQLLPDLHLLFCVLSVGTSAPHQPSLALHSLRRHKQLLALDLRALFLVFFSFLALHFIHLHPSGFLSVLVSFSFPCFLFLSYPQGINLPPNKIYLSHRFTSCHPDALADLFFLKDFCSTWSQR